MNILFAAPDTSWSQYEPPLRAALAAAGVQANLSTEIAPEDTDYIIYAPSSDLQDFTPFTRCKAVLNLWAGVEEVVGNNTLTQPLIRMVDPGLTDGMVEWVVGHTLRHHLGMDAHVLNPEQLWQPVAPPLARNRGVTILGLGTLGTACAQALAALNFRVTGWSRRQKAIPGVTCLSGEETLREALSVGEVVILLLPDTPATENTLNASALAALPKGTVILNPGRGPLIDDQALLEALGTGQVAHATLDTFRVEPLPADHPFWAHPNITVCPHIASETRPDTASLRVVENIQRIEQGAEPIGLVDRALGY